MDTSAAVDILIPCYNYGRYLQGCVQSALQADGPPARILIIDDASADDTPHVGASLAARHSNVRYVRHDRNRGHIETYNEGIQWARSPYHVLLSADDLLPPGALRRATSFLRAHPEAGLVYGRTTSFSDTPPRPAPEAGPCRATVTNGLEFLRKAAEGAGNPIPYPVSVTVRTDLQQAIGGYRRDLPHSGDMEMYLRFAAHAAVGFVDAEQGWYRRHSNNMSSGYQNVADYRQKLMAFETAFNTCRHRLYEHAALTLAARRSVLRSALWSAHHAFEGGNDRDVDDLLAFAVSVDPGVRSWQPWRTLQIKRVVGRRIVRCAESVMRRAAGGGRE